MLNFLLIILLTDGDWIAIVAISVSVLGTVGWLIYRTGCIVTLVKEMKPSVSKIPVIETKVDELWRLKTTTSGSPSILNDYGKKILKDSNIAEIILPYHDDIISLVKSKEPSNAYTAQETLIEILEGYINKQELKDKLEEAAYNAGIDVNTLLFVAAINIRDMVIESIGFKRDDIDNHDP